MTGQDTYKDGKLDSIRNPDGFWINTQVFREEGTHFTKYGYYISDPWGSPAWLDYWTEQRRRCINGYTVGGVTITGEHYFYLNFCPILKVEDSSQKRSRKVSGFPDFWDGDYNYFWSRKIARDGVIDLETNEEELKRIVSLPSKEQIPYFEKYLEGLKLEVRIPSHTIIKGAGAEGEDVVKLHLNGGYNLIVGKSRRKGYSYKNASIAACNFFTKPDSLTIFNAYEKKFLYPGGIMTMALNYISFINENTGWTMPSDVVNRTDHIKASYIQYRDGAKLEKGFKSQIMAYTCKDNPDANRGKDALDIAVEEAGAFGTPGLLKSLYKASEDCVKAGDIQTGLITIFGTSGDMEGGTADYADMHSRPLAFDLLPFNNIWDDDSIEQKVGFFHPINWNMEGFYDDQGNSDMKAAKQLELINRKNLIKNGATSVEIQQRMQEKPLGPAEAFGMVSVNNFPVVELKRRLQKVKSEGLQLTKGTPVELSYNEGQVVAEPILNLDKVTPITSYLSVPKDIRGVPIIYEYPVAGAPPGLYKIGYDPIRQDVGTSLAGIIVYKGILKGSAYHDIIVAEYVGRKEKPNDIDDIALMLADLYNTKIMHENEVPGVINYFRRKRRLDALARQPDRVISKNVKNSKTARVFGCHMVGPLKDAGERYIKEWLLKVVGFDENGNSVTTIDYINSQRLLEELISYRRDGNFDLISALIMCMFQVQEEEIGHEHQKGDNTNSTLKKLSSQIDKLFAK